jgi:hypothetical protein
MITIHFDFVDGTEVSYLEGKKLGDNFTTNCLDFFNFDEITDDVIVLKKNGEKISRKNIQNHTTKEIRPTHNIHKMLLANSFTFLK